MRMRLILGFEGLEIGFIGGEGREGLKEDSHVTSLFTNHDSRRHKLGGKRNCQTCGLKSKYAAPFNV
ncbi:uncharacterized protein G2W53_019533 [Senna tora]|uniref:Uncharacterized protein n=1 Tax=Senna tora TaxID=362788 RepID=A0A834TV63_9FABA|nr:uncharacterized protein G2W53_019533 [Senna tora]